MKAFEFETTLTAEREVTLPFELKMQLAPGSAVRVILLLADPDEAQDWARLTTEQFFKGYAPADSVYDAL